jgi:hypothetical protein
MMAASIDAMKRAAFVLRSQNLSPLQREHVAAQVEAAAEDVARLLEAATAFGQIMGGRAIADPITVHRCDIRAIDLYRLQEAAARVRGKA